MKTSVQPESWTYSDRPSRFQEARTGSIWKRVLLASLCFGLVPNIALGQGTPSRPMVPQTQISRPAIEELLGIDPNELELGPPLWDEERPSASRDSVANGPSEPAPSLPIQGRSVRPNTEHSNRVSSAGGIGSLDDFFSEEMKALLEGSARRRAEDPRITKLPPSTPATPRRNRLEGSGDGTQTLSYDGGQRDASRDLANGYSSNPLRSNDRRSSRPEPQLNAPRNSAPGLVPTVPNATANASSNNVRPRGAPPRSLVESGDARPLISSNPRSQSLLTDTGNIGLLSSESEDTIELAPPDTSLDDGVPANPSETRRLGQNRTPTSSSSPLNRSLSEVITSPNLPMQMGFHADELDANELDANERNESSIKNRLNPADFEALVQQQSRPGPRRDSAAAPNQPAGYLSPGDASNDEPTVPVPNRLKTVDRETRSLVNDRPKATESLQLNRNVEARLFEFEKLRQRFNQSFADDHTPVAESEWLAEMNYRIWRGEFEQAHARIDALNHGANFAADRWEVAWLTAEAAIGLHSPELLAEAEQQMRLLCPTTDIVPTAQGLESIYLDYVAAHRSLLKANPDYVASVASLRRVLEAIATNIPEATPWARQRLSWILLRSQLDMARCIALGPYRSAPTSADEWFKQANTTAEQLIQSQVAVPLLRLAVVRTQIECYADTGRFREIPPLVNYLATWEHQLQGQGLSDDALWIGQETTAILLHCGLLAYNHQQMELASNWVQQVIPRLERAVQQSPDSHASADVAAAYWLQGALQMHGGHSLPAVRAFEVVLQNWPLESEQRPTSRGLEWGDRLAIMAVAYWSQDNPQRALQLNQEAVVLIQNAIDAGLAAPERLETPLANLAVMTQANPAIVGTETMDQPAANSMVQFESNEQVSDETTDSETGVEIGEIRQQLENPMVVAAERERSVTPSSLPQPTATTPSQSSSSQIKRTDGTALPSTSSRIRHRLPARARLR